tara:strand:+ start:833 stop:1768 length:936 start_codon:yes stop_codon:yes gene_type:complete
MNQKQQTLVISFSGGRTSGYLTKKLLENKDQWKDVIVIFANTGQEHEKTLEFINKCDKEFGFQTVWIEAVTNPKKGKGTTAKIVNFKTASRDGKPFESVIKKYGIPWSKASHCTRELKEYPIKAYLRSLGLKNGDYKMAIGIRADEFDRMSPTADSFGLIYPLVKWNKTKEDILDWWEDQKFDLEIPEHFGNCVWCWKKSDKKLMTIMVESPEAFDFPERMEKKYGQTGAMARHLQKNGVLKKHKSIKFFRGFKSVQDIRGMVDEGFEKFIDVHHFQISNGCSDSCEPFHGDVNQLTFDYEAPEQIKTINI